MNIATISLLISWSILSFSLLFYKKIKTLELNFSFPKYLIIFLPLYLVDYYILGPNSYVNMDSDGNLMVPALYSLIHNASDQMNLTLGGGQDTYIWFLGQQYFQPEKLIMAVAPIWVTILAHKLIVALLSFSGIYFLALRSNPDARLSAAMLAIALTASHAYLTDYSLSFGTGFAAIPFYIYLCVARSNEENYWRGGILAAVILMAADPMKVFPALAIAILCSVIALRNLNLRRIFLTFMLTILLSILNWHEVLYALIQSSEFVGRGIGRFDGATPPPTSIKVTFMALWTFTYPFLIFCAMLIYLFIQRDKYIWRALMAVAVLLGSILFLDMIDWLTIGLEPINRLSHQQYMILAFPTIVAIIFSQVISRRTTKNVFIINKNLSLHTFLILTAIFAITYQKSHNFLNLLAFGGQAVYHKIDALNSPVWKDRKGYRSVTFYETPNANITAGIYGIPTFDAQANLNNQFWSKFWVGIFHNQSGPLVTRIGWQWQFWTRQGYEADKHVRFDLLASANVRYVFSPLPLISDHLTLLYEPKAEEIARSRPDMFENLWDYTMHRLNLIFSGGDVYVYEIMGAVERFYAATKFNLILDDLESAEYFDYLATKSRMREAVIRRQDSALSKDTVAEPFTITQIKEMKNGYRVEINAQKSGFFMINMPFWPWWHAQVDGQDTMIIPANGAQMAIQIPAQSKEVVFFYRRPTFVERLRKFIFEPK